MNINFVLGIVIFIIVLLICVVIWINSIHKLWSKQPMFRIYNLKYFIFPPGIIQHNLPVPNNLCDFFFTQTVEMKFQDNKEKTLIFSFSPKLITHFTNFLRKNATISHSINYRPKAKQIVPYFQNNLHPSYLTVYTNSLQNLKVEEFSSIEGYITSRPIELWLDGYKIIIYFMDYLCVKRNKRNKGLTHKLIQSHIYKQRHENKAIDITLFRKSKPLKLIVPFVVYLTYGFDLHYWKIPTRMHSRFKILEINKENFFYCREILHNVTKFYFTCCVFPTMSNIATLIDTGNLIMYALLENKEIISLYIFKNPTCYKLEKQSLDDSDNSKNNIREKKIIQCLGSVNNSQKTNLFILGFHHTIFLLRKKKFEFVLIDNIAHCDAIIENILTKYTPKVYQEQSYYFHNFAYKTKKSNDVIIIS